MHCFYFIYASKLYVRTHVKFMRQWKSTRRLVLHLGTWPWFLRSVIKYILNTSDNNPVFYWNIILPISARYIYHSRLRTTLRTFAYSFNTIYFIYARKNLYAAVKIHPHWDKAHGINPIRSTPPLTMKKFGFTFRLWVHNASFYQVSKRTFFTRVSPI